MQSKKETEILRIKDNKSNIKDISVFENINPAEKNEDNELKAIEIKGNVIKYQNRIFVYNHNSSKYQGKLERKIFFCQYHYHQINRLSKNKLPPFCSMKITYYPNNSPDKRYKITGEHTYECIQKYNEDRTDKTILLDTFENYQEKCINEYNKNEKYNRKEFIEIAYKILNDDKYKFKISENKIKNMISKWKNNSQKFTKYLFLNDTLTFDGNNLLQSHIYKIITYKIKRITFECFIWVMIFSFRDVDMAKIYLLTVLFISQQDSHNFSFLCIMMNKLKEKYQVCIF